MTYVGPGWYLGMSRLGGKDILGLFLGCGPPSQDASQHKDYYMFRIGDSYKPSFATGILGGG